MLESRGTADSVDCHIREILFRHKTYWRFRARDPLILVPVPSVRGLWKTRKALVEGVFGALFWGA